MEVRSIINRLAITAALLLCLCASAEGLPAKVILAEDFTATW